MDHCVKSIEQFVRMHFDISPGALSVRNPGEGDRKKKNPPLRGGKILNHAIGLMGLYRGFCFVNVRILPEIVKYSALCRFLRFA